MAEWNRTGREDDQRRYGEDRRRQELGGQTRWSDQDWRRSEERSFDDRRQAGYGRGGQDWQDQQRYAGESAGYQDESRRYGAQGYSGSEYASQAAYGQPYGSQQRQGQAYGQSYGQSQTYGQGQGYQGGQSYSPQTGGGQGYGNQGWGGQSQSYGEGYRSAGQQGAGRDMIGGNEAVRRVTDGDFERDVRAFGGGMQAGEHRGRGPKNYTRSDERIREDVNDRLSDDSWLDASEIEVQVSKCEVTLSGTVNSRDDKRRAEDVAEQVSGVKHVQNNLRVQQTGQQASAGQTSAGQSAQASTDTRRGSTAM